MRRDSKNVTLSIVFGGLESAAALCSTGTLIQALLASVGFSANEIYIHSTVVQAVCVLTILLASRWADKGNLLKRHAIIRIINGVLFLFYLPICILHEANVFTYSVLLAVSICQSVANGLHTVCGYKLPYYIYEDGSFGFITAIGGILSNVLSLIFGALISYLSQTYSFAYLMVFAMVLSCGFSIFAGILRFYLKSLLREETDECQGTKEEVPLKDVLLHPSFKKLILANLARGFSAGATTIFAVIASTNLGYTESITSAIVPVQSIAMLVSFALFAVSNRVISPRIVIFAGSVCFICLPFLMIPNQPVLFLLLVGIIIMGRNLVDSAIPTLLLCAVPVKIAGPYHAWRMVLFNMGTLLATLLATVIPVEIILLAACVCQVYCGIVFWRTKLLRQVSPLRPQR